MSHVYLISDLHIGHKGIGSKFQRTFKSDEDCWEYSIMCWNSIVRKRDVVKVLGDFIMNIASLHYLSRFNGTIHWILGNHDPKITREILQDYLNISYVGGAMKYKGCFLTHIPIHPNELEYRNVIMNIHGHVHHKDQSDAMGDKYYNVNVDVMGHFPREFHSIMKERGLE